MAEPEPVSDGVLQTLRRLLTAVTGILRNRTELFAVELQEEKHALFEVLVLGGVVLALGILVLALITMIVILLFAAPYRIYAAGALALLYSALAALFWRRIRKHMRRQPFNESLSQLDKDWECLKPRN